MQRLNVAIDRQESWYEMPVVRVSEARVKQGLEAQFLQALRELVATFPEQHAGMEQHEILVDCSDPRRVVYVSRWRDRSALVEYAGVGWETDPVTFPDEQEMLEGAISLRHFDVL